MTADDVTFGPDVDLDDEVILLPDGERLTEERAEQLAENVVALHRGGRPSVSGGRKRTPVMSLRVPEATRAALEALARAQGRRLADVSRDALNEYVRTHSS
ncbi:MAG: hypothetical protein J2O48_05135 [Solirubrobacterales bacterium]|nr:hypothetical protein [Solirubrobacterales bacterium]